MEYTGDGQIVHAFNPSGQKERLRVPLFGGDIVHVVRTYDEESGRLTGESVELTSVAIESGWHWDAPVKPKRAPKPKTDE